MFWGLGFWEEEEEREHFTEVGDGEGLGSLRREERGEEIVEFVRRLLGAAKEGMMVEVFGKGSKREGDKGDTLYYTM